MPVPQRLWLRGLPVALFAAYDEHAQGLLREGTLAALHGQPVPFSVAELADAGAAQAALADAVGAPDSASEPAHRRDVELVMGPECLRRIGVLRGVLDRANSFAAQGGLLMLPELPELTALRNWIGAQIQGQAAGAAAQAWRLPAGEPEGASRPLASWPAMAELPAGQLWLVGDDSNRIIGASQAALDLLGWEQDQLIGRRILAVVPEPFRERHVAAFTRAVLTGEHRLLNQPLEVQVETHDGRSLDVTLTLQQHSGTAGRAVYLARLERR